LKELGEDPVTKRNVVVRTGRFGLYVTDGEVNATLRLGDTPETISLDRACELLAERRNAEPSSRPAKRSRRHEEAREEGDQEITAKKATGTAKRAAVAQGEKSNAALIAATHTDE